jgi:hypothetical protein
LDHGPISMSKTYDLSIGKNTFDPSESRPVPPRGSTYQQPARPPVLSKNDFLTNHQHSTVLLPTSSFDLIPSPPPPPRHASPSSLSPDRRRARAGERGAREWPSRAPTTRSCAGPARRPSPRRARAARRSPSPSASPRAGASSRSSAASPSPASSRSLVSASFAPLPVPLFSRVRAAA